MNKSLALKRREGMSAPLLAFLLGLAVALAIFLPFWVVDKGFFLYAGDYNSQQIPFYYHVNQFIKAGGGTWSWATDLGSSVITSYSFYNIGSPFLWLSLIFPAAWVPFLMVPLFALKFGAIAGAACLFLNRYAKTRNMAVVSSLLFAFCGFNVYNVFFNHMLDPVAIFPLMLWALDGFMYDKKRGFFALTVGLALLDSYFFFTGNVVFVLLYFVVKVALGEYRVEPAGFGMLALEAVLGVGIGMALALPSFYTLVQNPRTSSVASGFGLLLYGSPHQYANILTSLFLPPDPPYLPNLFTEGIIKWTSMTAFLPVVGIAGVASYWRSRRRSSIKWLLGICFVCALVPFLNSAFYAFNSSYYARWYYMPILMMCFATLRSLEDADIDLMKGIRLTALLTGVYVVIGLLPQEKNGQWVVGLAQYASKYWLSVVTAFLGLGIFAVVVYLFRHKPRFGAAMMGAVMGFSVFYSVIHLSLVKFPQWVNDSGFYNQQYVSARNLQLPEYDGFYRIDTYQTHDNIALWMNQSSLQTFNSTVTPSIYEFYPMVGVKRDVRTQPDRDLFALRGLLNARYTLMPVDKRADFEAAVGERETGGNLGWHYVSDDGILAVYENENFIPLGTTYTHYISMEMLNSIAVADRAGLLVRNIGLSQEQIEKYGYLFQGGEDYFYAPCSYENYRVDVRQRQATAAYHSSADASGFTCKILLEQDRLVFFSVPYDEGFSATVNGVPAEVLNVSGGMMAVLAPAGDSTIVFRYRTPGFRTGLLISFASLAGLGAYLLLVRRARLKKKQLAQTETDTMAGLAAPGMALGGGEKAGHGGRAAGRAPPKEAGKGAPPAPQDADAKKPPGRGAGAGKEKDAQSEAAGDVAPAVEPRQASAEVMPAE